jgi:hypothetical protein
MFCYNEGKGEPPTFFVSYHKMNAVKGYLYHYKNFLYLRFIRDNPLSTDAEKRQAIREIAICDRKLTWWQRHPNYDEVAVQVGKKALHNIWRRNPSTGR